MEGAIHQHRLRFDGSPDPRANLNALGRLPDYSKDADAAPAALPYNSLSQIAASGGDGDLKETRHNN